MQISIVLNGKKIQEEIEPDLLLIDFVRKHGCKSVKRGCETSGCGLCTVFLDDKPVLSEMLKYFSSRYNRIFKIIFVVT